MGLSFSKSRSSNESKDNKSETLGKEVTTPKGKTNVVQLDPDLDPRSPTENIMRTPIQVSSGPILDTPTAVYTPKRIILAEDPRSPTTEYHRTPIVIGVVNKSPTLKIHNKNLDKALKGYSTVSPNPKVKTDTATPAKEHGTIIPPKLLETSPVRLVRIDAHKRRSCVGLLETNLDFTETDIDEVIMKKYHSPSIKKAASEPRIYNRVDALSIEARIDPRSPTTDFKRTPIQIMKKLNEINANIADCASSEEETEKKTEDNNLVNLSQSIDNKNAVDCNSIIEEPELPHENEIIDTTKDISEPSTPYVIDETCEEIEINTPEISNVNRDFKTSDNNADLKCEPLKISKISPEKPPRKLSSSPKPNDMTVLLKNEQIAAVIDVPNKSQDTEEVLSTVDDKERTDINNINDHPSPSNLNLHICEEKTNQIKIQSSDHIAPIIGSGCGPILEHVNELVADDDNEVPPTTPNNSKTRVFTPNNKIDITADVRDFDKKLTNLIYEDSDVSVLPPIIKNKDSIRTPLGERDMNSQAKKTSKLKVSDRPRYAGGKPEVKGTSKIPTLQNKTRNKVIVDSEKSKIRNNKKVMVQCENTPPRNMPGYNGRKSNIGKSQPQWDNDATLII